jgi:hypothetical protein
MGDVRHFRGMLTLAFAMAAPIAKPADISATTYVHAGKLLDVRSGKMLNDQVIVIRGDRIEFERMTRYGMTPLQAIQAATIKAADLMGWRIRLAPSSRANLLT